MLKNKKQKLLSSAAKFNDVVFLGQILFVVAVLLISWSSLNAIQTNYTLQKQISVLSQQNSITKLQNDNLSLEGNYYNSNQYLELAARQNFSLASPGETEVIVPQSVALANTVNLAVDNQVSSTKNPNSNNNLNSWIKFFLHKN